MKKFIALLGLILLSANTILFAQESNVTPRDADRKAEKKAEKSKLRAEKEAEERATYELALQALNNKRFVLEADQVIFKRGQTAFVSSNTNFVMLNGQRATVQVAFNTPYPGPNGIGGVTVDGTTSDVKVTTDKRGNVNCNFSVQGIGISAQVFITLTNGGNNATVTINPNFNSNTLTLSGNLVPLNQSDVFKGRSW